MRAPHLLASTAALLTTAVGFAGCSGSSRRTTVVTAPAATTTSGSTTTPGATPGATPGSQIPQAPASQGTPLGHLNGELQAVWDNMRPLILAQVNQMAATQLQGQKYTSSAVDLDIINVRLGSATQMLVAPGLTRLDTKGLVLRAPLTGSWQLVLEADAQVRVKIGSFSPAINLPLAIYLEDLTLELQADLDDSDPTRLILQRVGQPQINFRLRLDSSNPLVQNLTGVLNQPANWLANTAIQVGLSQILPLLNGMNGVPGPIVTGGAPLADSGVATPFAEVVQNAEIKSRQVNMPHGTVLLAQMDTPATDTWLDAYRNGGTGNPGTVVNYGSGGDSAIFTGMYLGAQAFRFAMGDPLAMDTIGHTLGGVQALLDVNGATGLLARVAAPANSMVGQNIARHRAGVFRTATYRGETWVSHQGSNGISRDQYSGVMFGLSLAYEHVPAVRAECARRLHMILDYLIARDWIVDEDRPLWNGTNGSRGPTFWLGNTQKLTFLLMGHRTDPTRYVAQIAQAGPLAETAWLGAWTGTFGIDHYYKFNLSSMSYYNYFRLETDTTRWQAMHRAYSLSRRFTGHHRNAWFDLADTTIDPQSSTVLFPQVREVMRQFLNRNHREVAPAVIDLSGVTWVTSTQTAYSNTPSGGFTVGTTSTQVPFEPLDVPLRRVTGHFLWQRDPFTPATPNSGNPRAEKHGLDLVLPYWMGRFYGAFQ